MVKRRKVLISLGSNTRQQDNIARAKTLLRQIYPAITFSTERWTAPVGVPTDRFLNCTAQFDTTEPMETVAQQLKTIEQRMGDSHENHRRNIVLIDLDLIRYGHRQLRNIVWQP